MKTNAHNLKEPPAINCTVHFHSLPLTMRIFKTHEQTCLADLILHAVISRTGTVTQKKKKMAFID